MSTNSIIVTHNARLRCLITKLFNKSSIHTDAIKRRNFKEYRWQNCCVLKLLLTKSDATNFNFNLSLIYDGEIDPTENKPDYQYWGNKSGEGETTQASQKKGFMSIFRRGNTTVEPVKYRFNQFEPLTGTIRLAELNDAQMVSNMNPVSNSTYAFYLVRHGQAEHNLYSKTTVFRKTDTSLTQNGVRGALYSGYAINDDLELNNALLKYFFTSDLIRTRQTLESILSGIQSKYMVLDTRANIINLVVLPCAHELSFVSDGNCDSKVNMGQPFTNENKMSCTELNNYSSSTPQFKACVSYNVQSADNINIVVKINWNMYFNFYGNSYRGSKAKTRKQCRQTSMIEESMNYILTNQSGNQSAGRRRKRRKTYKRRK